MATRSHLLVLAAVTFAGIALQRYYVGHDGRPLTYDDAWYLENSLNLYHRLAREGTLAFAAAYSYAFRVKAPLLAVLPLPFFRLFGPSLAAALWINSLFLALLNVYLYRLGAKWYSAEAGLMAVLIFQTMPLAIGMSRAFMTEYGLAALVTVFIYYLEDGPGFVAGALAGLGLLMKITFATVVAAPCLVMLRGRSRRALSIGAAATLVAGTWYAFNLAPILRFAWQASYGALGSYYQVVSREQWLRNVIFSGISPYYAAAVLALGGAALFLDGWKWSERSMVLAGWFLLPTAAVWLGKQQDPRHILVVLPPLALWLGDCTCRLLRHPALKAAFLVVPLLSYAALTFPIPQLDPLYRSGLWWARRPDYGGDWGQRRIVDTMRSLAAPGGPRRYVVVGVEHPFFNANLLGYLNAYDDGPFQFTSLGLEVDLPEDQALERALERIRNLNPSFVVMAEGFGPEDLEGFLNRLNERIRASLERGELPFRRCAEVPLANGIRAVLYCSLAAK